MKRHVRLAHARFKEVILDSIQLIKSLNKTAAFAIALAEAEFGQLMGAVSTEVSDQEVIDHISERMKQVKDSDKSMFESVTDSISAIAGAISGDEGMTPFAIEPVTAVNFTSRLDDLLDEVMAEDLATMVLAYRSTDLYIPEEDIVILSLFIEYLAMSRLAYIHHIK